nr:MAG TPA: hypothetical protein [Caudoviricetes sp.]
MSGIFLYGEKLKMDKKFDKEYSTQWIKEVKWLSCHNVRFTFVKRDTNGITIYKYKKTHQLFSALAEFYCRNGD